MKSLDEQLTWAKQRALICVGVGRFADAVAGLRADLDKGAMSSEHAMRGYKAASDAALGRGSQALTEWIDGLGSYVERGGKDSRRRAIKTS